MQTLTTVLLKKKRCILDLPSLPQHLCFAAAVLVCKKKVDGTCDGRYFKRKKTLHPLVLNFQQSAGVPVGVKCGAREWQQFQTCLGPDYDLVILSSDFLNSVVFRGHPQATKRITIYHAEDHYYPVTSLKAFFGQNDLCDTCLKPHTGSHACPARCSFCNGLSQCSKTSEQYCGECNLIFPSPPCFERHKQNCGSRYRCRTCGFILRRGASHTCNQRFCNLCSKTVPMEHQCYMKVLKEEKVTDRNLYVFFDFESMLLEDSSHHVNLVVAHLVCGRCMSEPVSYVCPCDVRQFRHFSGENALSSFMTWLFKLKHRKLTCMAHNGRFYDFSLILQYLHQHGVKPEITQNGCKIMQLKVQGRRFIDSLSFLPMALKKIPAAFGLSELCKGHFAHQINTAAWQNYAGPFPPKSSFDPDGMSASEREEFNAWYEEHRTEHFDFQEQLLRYCESDTDILRRGIGSFRQLFISCTGVGPSDYLCDDSIRLQQSLPYEHASR